MLQPIVYRNPVKLVKNVANQSLCEYLLTYSTAYCTPYGYIALLFFSQQYKQNSNLSGDPGIHSRRKITAFLGLQKC